MKYKNKIFFNTYVFRKIVCTIVNNIEPNVI